MSYIKYTKELLEEKVISVFSGAALARSLGLAPTGSNLTNLRRRCQLHEIDISHWTGQAHQKGRPARNRLTADQILVLNEDVLAPRSDVRLLRRSLREIGVEEKCSVCELVDWNNKPLRLQIDHIDGNFRNNRRKNLRFICPNCHTQTETWGNNKM